MGKTMPVKLTKPQLEARFEALSEAQDHCYAMAGDCGNEVLSDAYNWAGKKMDSDLVKLLRKINRFAE